MTVWDVDHMLALAYWAGWRHHKGLNVAVAIARAESGWNDQATGTNPPTHGCPHGSRDRGLWQINDCYHPTVSDKCAYDPRCNAQQAFIIAGHDSNFQPWSTWQQGVYRQYMPEVDAAYKKGRWQHYVRTWGQGTPPGPSGNPQPTPPPPHPQGTPNWDWHETVHHTGDVFVVAGASLQSAGNAIRKLTG